MTFPHNQIIDFLVDRRFPDVEEVHNLFHSEAHPCSEEVRDRMRDIEAYRRELSLKPLAELQSLEVAEIRKEEQERFYNQPYADADFSFWSKMPCWNLEEAVALSFGKCPEVVNTVKLEGCGHTSPFIQKYHRLRDWVERARRTSQLAEPVVPKAFIAWARQNEVEFPATLEAAVAAREESAPSIPASGGRYEDNLHPKERPTVLKLIIAMAVKSYNYNPSNFRNEAIKRITSHVYDVGLSIDEDTVRNWLKESAELLSRVQAQ